MTAVRFSPGDPVIWTNPTTGKELPAVYKGSHGLWQIIETLTETGHLGLRYVHARDIRPAGEGNAG